jgi:transcriptional regulator with XRE-family HTH domain
MQLRDYRLSKGLSQEDAAKELQISQSLISRYEQGMIPRYAARIERIREWSGGRVGPDDWYNNPARTGAKANGKIAAE